MEFKNVIMVILKWGSSILYVCCYRCNRNTVIWYSNISLRNKVKLQTIYSIFIKTNIYYNKLKTTPHGFNIFINNCLFNMHMFNIQHKEHVQISHVSYIRKPRLSGNFLGNECVRINEVSLYVELLYSPLGVLGKKISSLYLKVRHQQFTYKWRIVCYLLVFLLTLLRHAIMSIRRFFRKLFYNLVEIYLLLQYISKFCMWHIIYINKC